MRKITTFTFLFISMFTYGQKNNFGIKFSPLALADDINFRAIQLGFENRLTSRFTLYNEIGIKYGKSSYERTDTVWGLSPGYKYKLEVRYYFRNRFDNKKNMALLKGWYVGANMFYSFNTYNYQISYASKTDSAGWRADNFKVKKIIKSSNLIIGHELIILKYIYLDLYCGIGFRMRIITTEHKEFDAEKDVLQTSLGVAVGGGRDYANSEDKRTALPNLTAGFRIGIKF